MRGFGGEAPKHKPGEGCARRANDRIMVRMSLPPPGGERPPRADAPPTSRLGRLARLGALAPRAIPVAAEVVRRAVGGPARTQDEEREARRRLAQNAKKT